MVIRTKTSAALVFNPGAGRLSKTDRDGVVGVLRDHFTLEVIETAGRGSGLHHARELAGAGVKLVIAFGGDGIVNEVVNGVAGTATSLGIVPGGTMNVFARALGLPASLKASAEMLVKRVEAPPRQVHLGKMGDRLFTFAAGCGFDAEAAELVERDVPNKRRFGEIFFYWNAARVLAGTYRHRDPSMTISGAFGKVPVSMAIACNAGPYAYLAGRAVNLAPEVEISQGLDLFALRRMRLEALGFYAWASVVSGSISRHKDAFLAHDLETFTVSSDVPFARHVDGEPLGPAMAETFSLERNALRVLA
jgi:diacylglycerol kinase family enzyme